MLPLIAGALTGVIVVMSLFMLIVLITENQSLKSKLKKHCADPADPSDHCPLCSQEKLIKQLQNQIELKDLRIECLEKSLF